MRKFTNHTHNKRERKNKNPEKKEKNMELKYRTLESWLRIEKNENYSKENMVEVQVHRRLCDDSSRK